MTYKQKIEAAIEDGDVDLLIQYAYGYPCKCTTIKGEPMCVCKMYAAALRKMVAPAFYFRTALSVSEWTIAGITSEN